MKDYFDLWVISRIMQFKSIELSTAIRATLACRGTTVPTLMPIGLTDAFALDGVKQQQWRAFLRRGGTTTEAPGLKAIVAALRSFLEPVLPHAQSVAPLLWPPGGPWNETS